MLGRVIVGLCMAVVLAFVGLRVCYSWYYVPSAAMEPTLYQGDLVVAANGAYGWSRQWAPGAPPSREPRWLFHAPVRGDIVLFRLPRDGRTVYIKRLIGLPGDRVQMKGGTLYINDKAVGERQLGVRTAHDRGGPEPVAWIEETNPEGRRYVIQDHGRGYAADDTEVYVVPRGCYFMLGDNRDNSADSRFDPGVAPDDPKLGGCGWEAKHDAALGDIGTGFVPEGNLVGRVDQIIRGQGGAPGRP